MPRTIKVLISWSFWSQLSGLLARVSIFLCYGFADRLGRMLGATGMTVIVQLTSFLLVCIGVQILWNGARALLEQVRIPPLLIKAAWGE